jgi:hypothetical protein
MLPLTRRTHTEKRRKEDALMARTWTIISRTYSVFKEPYDDELKDPLSDPDKAFGALNEGEYRAELELVDRYQSFVAELLRLSLAGIAVFGFLYQIIFQNLDLAKVPTLTNVLAAIGVLMFGISAAAALLFRFLATEGARFYIEALRFTPANAGREQKERARKRLEIREERVRICRWSKGIAAVTLALGAVLEAVAFVVLLIAYPLAPRGGEEGAEMIGFVATLLR